jgi:hypothetical protein
MPGKNTRPERKPGSRSQESREDRPSDPMRCERKGGENGSADQTPDKNGKVALNVAFPD